MERRNFFGAIIGAVFGTVAALKTSEDAPTQAVKPSFVLQDISLVSKGGEPILHCNLEINKDEIYQRYLQEINPTLTPNEIRQWSEELGLDHEYDVGTFDEYSF